MFRTIKAATAAFFVACGKRSAAIITSTNSTDFTLTPLVSGIEYIKNGEEGFDLIFSCQRNAFAMNYVDLSTVGTFSLDIFDGAANVGSASFVTASINREWQAS